MGNFYHFENRFMITATLRMKTPLSVGSRISLLPAGSDLPVIKTPQGVPYIPGSSLKGVVRAYTERLLRTLDTTGNQYRGQRLWACDPLDKQHQCVTDQRKKELAEATSADAEFTRRIWEESCTACRLFGSPWLASRIYFQDALLSNEDELPRLTEVRDGVGIDRDLGTAKRGIKFDFETVPAEASFSIRIVVENAEDWEVGLLLLSLKAMEQGELPIGGKTTRGLGWGELTDLKVKKVTPKNLLDWLQGKPPQTVEASALISAFTQGLPQGGGDDA